MPKTLIGVDLCNTIADINVEIERLFNLKATTYPIHGISQGFFTTAPGLIMFRNAMPYPFAAKILWGIAKADCEIVYITTRPKVAAFVTDSWLKTNNFPAGRVVFVSRESKAEFVTKAGISCFFEDDPLVVNELIKTEMRYVFVKEWPYNTGLIHKKVIKFSNWRELMDWPLFEKQDINMLLGQCEIRVVAQKGGLHSEKLNHSRKALGSQGPGVLGQFKSRDGYLENDEYLVTWAIGHLVELANPEDYDPKLKKWTFETLPILPDSFKLKANPKTIKQFKIVKELVNRSDIDQLICATDAGREGELIFRYIYRLSGCKKPFKRLWLSETTPAAIRKGFLNLRPGTEYDQLGHAAQARSQADWLIGINATRSFTVRHNNLLSVGRVQTPTLALIVNREREINNFVPQAYWELYAQFTKDDGQAFVGKWFHDDQNRFHDPEKAQAIQTMINGQSATVDEVEEKDLSEQPPTLFNLNDLQKEANKKFGLSAAKTLEVAQTLYETKKLLTYPRTDSRHLTQELSETIPDRLATLASVDEYNSFAATAQTAGIPGKRYVNDSKVSDHTALIPTTVKPNINNLTADERRIYDLVVRRFLAIFFPPAQYKQTKVITQTAGETFVTTGKVELERGWKSLYASTEKNEQQEEQPASIPLLVQGETMQTTNSEIQEKQTQPPKRYTEASLLAVMEGASRLLDDRELKEAMKGHGLGTPATRAAIIERLIKVGYIERQKKTLVPTSKGETLIHLVPDKIKNPEFTGQWEKTLAEIENGAANPTDFMAGINNLTKEIIELAKNQNINFHLQIESENLGKCPLCGKDVIESKKGYGCTGYKEGCKFVIWKEIAGKKITLNQAKTLLNKRKTGVIKGFKSKKGNKFDAVLQINNDNGKVEFLFDNAAKEESIGNCPLCKKEVHETAKGYGCSGYKDGCKFVIWKEIAGKKITLNQAKTLLTKGKTSPIKSFKSKAGNKFDAALVLGPDGKVNFEFDRGE